MDRFYAVCVNSVKINDVGDKAYITPELYVGAMAYVDDIMGAGNKEVVEKIGNNLKIMEKEKKYTFNNGNGKSHYMIIKTGRDKEEELDITVENGQITRTDEYKYLGNWLTETGTVERQLQEINGKIKGIYDK